MKCFSRSKIFFLHKGSVKNTNLAHLWCGHKRFQPRLGCRSGFNSDLLLHITNKCKFTSMFGVKTPPTYKNKIDPYPMIRHFRQVKLSSVNKKGKKLIKIIKAFLTGFAYRFNRRYWQTKPLIGFCMLVFTQILHLTCLKCLIIPYPTEFIRHKMEIPILSSYFLPSPHIKLQFPSAVILPGNTP